MSGLPDSWIHERPNIVQPPHRVFLAQLDQPPDVVVLEHHQAQHVVRARLARAEAARQKPERARQLRLVFVGEPAQIHRGPQHQQIDVAKAVALVLGQARRQRVHLLKLQGIRVQLVEEDRVVEHAGDLRRRRISAHGRTIRFFARPGVPRGNGDDPPRAKVDRRRERRGQPDAAVAVPRPVDFDRRKEERQRRRRHHMVDAELARDALSVRPLPRLDPAVAGARAPRSATALSCSSTPSAPGPAANRRPGCVRCPRWAPPSASSIRPSSSPERLGVHKAS